uniref:Fibronectin type-I domain-containing protein n=1 Tax=Eptatretus burgeri TaxID=7764 RepID=A0A8C4X144_EPTBU
MSDCINGCNCVRQCQCGCIICNAFPGRELISAGTMHTTLTTRLAVVATFMVLALPSNSAPANGSERLTVEHLSPTDVPSERTVPAVRRMRRAHHSANLLRLALARRVLSLHRAAQQPLMAFTQRSAEQPIVVLHSSSSSQERIQPEMIAIASVEGCWDQHLRHRFSVGDAWRRLHRGWLPLLCQCIANSKVHCTGNVQEALSWVHGHRCQTRQVSPSKRWKISDRQVLTIFVYLISSHTNIKQMLKHVR